MVTPRQPGRAKQLQAPSGPFPGGTDSGTKWLIGAVLAAGQDGCECPACQMLKKFGSSLSKSLLQEGDDDGNKGTVRDGD